MSTPRLTHLLILTVALSGLAACGGGGGGDDAPAPPASPTPSEPPPVNGMPAFPSEAVTGLTYPSKTLTLTSAQANELVQTAISTYLLSDEATAATRLGQEAPGALNSAASPAACSGGGSISYSASGSNYGYTYGNCVSGLYTYGGASTMALGTGTYAITYSNLPVAGPTGWTTGSDGLTGTTACKVSAGAAKCIATYKGFVWGYEHRFDHATLLANGSHQCNCQNAGSWNVVFENFGPSSGKAYVYATNGGAIITRNSASSFTVVLTVNSVTQTMTVTVS